MQPTRGMTRLVIVEGIPGAGKTTTARLVHDRLAQRGFQSRLYLEGDLNHPADFESVACLTRAEYAALKAKYPSWRNFLVQHAHAQDGDVFFHYRQMESQFAGRIPPELIQDIKRGEVYDLPAEKFCRLTTQRWQDFTTQALKEPFTYVFECCFLQNPLTTLLARHNWNERAVTAHIFRLAEILRPLDPLLIYLDPLDVRRTLEQVAQRRSKDWLDFVIQYTTGQGWGQANGQSGFEGMVRFYEMRRAVERSIFDRLALAKLWVEDAGRDWDDTALRAGVFLDTHAGQSAAVTGEFQALTGPYQHELLVHCYRMLGSLDDAEDALQECMLRAWRKLETLDEPGALRSWLYRIATNVSLDMLDRRKTRALPTSLSTAADPRQPMPAPVNEPVWLEPLPDEILDWQGFSPEARYERRESVTLAFLTVLQELPARQRAVLVLRDVLDWKAQEVAACLDLTLAAVNSALQRARATLKKYQDQRAVIKSALAGDARTTALLARYVTAWEDADADRLVALLREDAILTMPPLPAWYQGAQDIRTFFALRLFQGLPRGSFRLVSTRANSCPALAVYERAADGIFRPASLQVLVLDEDRIARIDCFLVSDDRLFRRFHLPPTD